MKGAVAAGHHLSAEAAAEILRAGGNAFDAAIGGFFAACVAEPALASLGGGGYLLARESGGQTSVFDFFTHTPGAPPADGGRGADFYAVTVDFGATRQVFHIGLGACAAPGATRGMFAVHRALGSLPMAELARPAIALARGGITVNAFQAYLLELLEPIYRTESAFPLFASNTQPGKLLQPGDVFYNPDFADALEALAAEGDALFYAGDIAARIAEACANGGYLTRDDLKNYRARRRAPLTVDYRGRRLETNPAPSAGGLLVALGLERLKAADLGGRGFEFGSAASVAALVEAQRAVGRLRDGDFGGGDSNGNGSGNDAMFGAKLANLLAQYREVCMRAHAPGGTTHLSVIDAERNIASLSVSNGEGCGQLVDGAGFMLNNMLGEADVNPGGFHQWRPGQRMASMMAPSILVGGADGALTALGSGGSNRIRSAILQVVSNLADFGMDAAAAVAGPRLHVDGGALGSELCNQLCIEAGFSDAAVRAVVGAFPDCRVFNEPHMFFGGVHLAQVNRRGEWSAVGDARRDGAGVVVE